MPGKNKIFRIFVCFAIGFLCSTCHKKIVVPDSEFKKLFGEWEWLESSGGFSGLKITPESEGYSISLSYSDRGAYEKFKNEKKTVKMRYYFKWSSSIYSAEERYLIYYKNKWGSKVGTVSDSFTFMGEDTLLIQNECSDCYASLYVRKK